MGLSTHSGSFCLWGKAGDLLTLDSSILSDTAKVVLGGKGEFLKDFCKLSDISGAV